MAKQSSARSGPSRIRFVMVEADLQEGDLEKVTQVLQNAFRTATPIVTRAPTAKLVDKSTLSFADENHHEANFVDEDDDQGIDAAIPQRQRPARKPKPAKVPTVLNDIDVKSDPALKDFVAEFDLKTGVDKYLVIALWFRDARSIDSITVDHVYTCFKILGWSTASNDFGKPLRNLRDEQSMAGGAKGYSLTLPGAGKIEAKKRGVHDV